MAETRGSGRIVSYRKTPKPLFQFLWLFSLNILETTDANVLRELRRRCNERKKPKQKKQQKKNRLAHRGGIWYISFWEFEFSIPVKLQSDRAVQKCNTNSNFNRSQSLLWHLKWMGGVTGSLHVMLMSHEVCTGWEDKLSRWVHRAQSPCLILTHLPSLSLFFFGCCC